MKLNLYRKTLKDDYTIGKLFIDDVYYCDVLEDKVRVNEPKIYGKTAIPYGTYKIKLTYSNRFKQIMPQLLDVPEFEGIRIHPGNIAEDTHGCLLVGINSQEGKVVNSKLTYKKLIETFNESKQKEWVITIQ